MAELLAPKRMVFIVNPKAGLQTQNRIRDSIEKHLDHKKFEYSIWFTEKPGHARELATAAVEQGYHIVVAVGGDGSINEIGTALIDTEVQLGIVPAGSGNGLAMHLGYGRNLDAAVKKLNTAIPRIIDCGLLNGRSFINLAGIGFDGLVSNLMQGSYWRGFVPYFIKSVQAGFVYTAKDCRLVLDDQSFTEKCFAITVANGPMYGYNFTIAPDAMLDDGFFELVILKDAPKWQYLAAVPATLNGKIYDAPFVSHYKTKKVRIEAVGDNYIHLDGEGLVLNGTLEFEIRAKALHILVPKPS
ncbi:MAG: diacylglycerol kinase family lipid kinase [Bacteroidetes bacterium]|nr:diacylglycerol kinase family lipid kinase [Bacteroidota bacterium]